MRDRVEPGAKVVAVAESRVGAKRGHEGLLEAILGLRWADQADQKPMQLRRVRVDEPLEWRKVHAGWNAWRHGGVRSAGGATDEVVDRVGVVMIDRRRVAAPADRDARGSGRSCRPARRGAPSPEPRRFGRSPSRRGGGAGRGRRRGPLRARPRPPLRHSFATSRMTWRRLMQRLSPQKARRRPLSSSSAAEVDWSAAAWTASIGGSIVTGHAWSGADHACHPARGASVAATSHSASRSGRGVGSLLNNSSGKAWCSKRTRSSRPSRRRASWRRQTTACDHGQPRSDQTASVFGGTFTSRC